MERSKSVDGSVLSILGYCKEELMSGKSLWSYIYEVEQGILQQWICNFLLKS